MDKFILARGGGCHQKVDIYQNGEIQDLEDVGIIMGHWLVSGIHIRKVSWRNDKDGDFLYCFWPYYHY